MLHDLPISLTTLMTPIADDVIPTGPDWGYQIKWDGVRLLAHVRGEQVHLFSRHMMPKNHVYPDVINILQNAHWQHQELLLDGEVVIFHPEKKRPVFQLALQRERTRGNSSVTTSASKTHQTHLPESLPAVYVLFDILYLDGQDMRAHPFSERHDTLLRLHRDQSPQLVIADLFTDGQKLWDWVEQHEWEGIVSKRLSSPYGEDKKHQDWFKKKTSVIHDVHFVGVLMREGRVASLVMEKDGQYFGNVSIGLNTPLKQLIMQIIEQLEATGYSAPSPLPLVPKPLANERLIWLPHPLACTVSGQEVTEGGLLRHPRIYQT